MTKKSSAIWEDRLVNGRKPEYAFGPKWYLGTPCRNGCRWPGTDFSLRSNYRDKRGRRSNPCACKIRGQDWLLSFLIQESIGISEKHRLGLLCVKRHDWKNTGFSLRHQGHCLECEKIRKKSPERAEQRSKYGREWYLRNREKQLANSKANRLLRLELDPVAEKAKSRIHRHHRKARERSAHSVPGVSKTEIQQHIKNNFLVNTCVYCGKKGAIHLDHFYPLALGGPNVLGNLVPSCPKCNGNKQAKNPEAWYFEQTFATKRGWESILQKINTRVSGKAAQLALF